VAEQSWLGNIWDSITGRDKEPANNGVLNYQPEIKPVRPEGVMQESFARAGEMFQGQQISRPASLFDVGYNVAKSNIQSIPRGISNEGIVNPEAYIPVVSEAGFIGRKIGSLFEPAGQALEDIGHGGDVFRFGEQTRIPTVTKTGQELGLLAADIATMGASKPGRAIARDVYRGTMDWLTEPPPAEAFQLGILAGPGSATADMPALLKANQLETEGVKPQKIFEQTGWYKDIDDQWKYEIPDKLWTPGDMVTPDDVWLRGIPKIGPAPGSKLNDILTHKRLYEAYPEAKNIQFEYDPKYGSGAAFMPGRTLSDSKIIIGDDIFDNDLAMQRILHEIQHGVQSFEGFAVGGNPEDFMKQLTQEKEGVLDLVKQTNTALNNIVREKDQLRSQFVPLDDPRILDLDRRYKEGLDYRANLVDSFKYWDSADLKEEAVSRYKSLAGEAEARNVPRRAKDQGLLGIIPTETTKGDIPKGYQSIEFEPTVMESSGLMDYTMRHRPPEREAGNTLDDLSMIYPEDLYSSKGWMYYGVGGSPEQQRMDTVSANIMAKVRGKPDAEVTVYRAVPKGVKDFNAGDWVTINREYAKGHGEGPLKGDYDIISKKVKASELTTEGNSLHEQGYWPLEK